MDLIGKIHPSSSKCHSYIIVATNYFTKWVEAQLMVSVTQNDIIKFIQNQIAYRFGIPEAIMDDQGTIFTCDKVVAFAQ